MGSGEKRTKKKSVKNEQKKTKKNTFLFVFSNHIADKTDKN
jgi:hypothetical protein